MVGDNCLDAGIIAQVQSSLKVKAPADIKKLAALNKAEWVGVLTKSASRIDVAGEAMDAGLIDQHASALARKLEKAFPLGDQLPSPVSTVLFVRYCYFCFYSE